MMGRKLGNVLITGGAGFVGANLTKQIINLNLAENIRVIDNESVGSRQSLAEFDVEFIEADIRDENALRKALSDIDCVVHLAADTRVMDSIANPRFNFENNVIASFNLMSNMAQAGITKLVNASTGGAILGEVPPPVNENMVPKPLSPYGASKLAMEGYSSAFAEIYDMQIVNLRFSNVYGPLSFHKGSVVATYLRAVLRNNPLTIYGDGKQTRDYVYTTDLCDGIVKALLSDKSGTFQLGTGIPTSINELISIIRSHVEPEYSVTLDVQPKRKGEIFHTYCDISKAKNELGYNPTVSLESGVKSTWNWFLNQDV